jgi:hypothetical protein
MADRYWVGGGSSANWAATAPTNWSDASGGVNNFSVPTTTDNAILDGVGVNANGSSIISAVITIANLSVRAGFTGTIAHNAVVTINGGIGLGISCTITGTAAITMGATTGSLTSNGKTWPNSINLSGGTKTFADGWILGGNLNILATTNIILSGLLTANAIVMTPSFNATFAGTFGWIINQFLNQGVAASTVTLQEGLTYTINTNFNAFANRNGLDIFTSNHATNKTYLILNEGATCNTNGNFTRIDASGGRPIRTWNGVVTDCINIQRITDLRTVSLTF